MSLKLILLTGVLFLISSVLSAEEFKVGEEFFGDFVSEHIKEGTAFRWVIYVPNGYDPAKPAALYLSHDGLNSTHAHALEKLAQTGDAPVTICVGLASGKLNPTIEGGEIRDLRAEEYDEVSSEYADFLVDEFIPWMIEHFHFNIDPSPDMHLVSGCSSGGISAWNIAWFRNDYFRRCFMGSPTFSAFRGGEMPLYTARIAESRPIRIYETYGEHEPNIYPGSSFLAAKFAENTFEFAGYACKTEYFPGGGHGAGMNDPEVAERGMKFLWENWKTEPVKNLKNQDRINTLVEFGTAWEETNDQFPKPVPAQSKFGTYTFDSSKIILTDLNGKSRVVSESFGDISGLAVSTDGWRLYVADRSRRFIFAVTIKENGELGKTYRLAPLRLPQDIRTIGAFGLCIDTEDRVYAATEMGVQGIIPFGIVDTLLTLPGDKPAEEIAFGGTENKTLYVRSGRKVYKRQMLTTGKPADFPITPPSTLRY